MITLGQHNDRIDLSNPAAKIRKQKAKGHTRALPGRHARSGNVIFYSSMSVPSARKLDEGDAVSVMGHDGQRHVGIIQKYYHGVNKVWVDVTYTNSQGMPENVRATSVRSKVNKRWSKMDRLVYPTNTKVQNF